MRRWTWLWKMYYPYSDVISLYNDFFHPVLKMIGCIIERVPRNDRKIVRPKWCFDVGKHLTDDWVVFSYLKSILL